MADDAVPQIGCAIRGDDADVSRAVAGELQYAEFCPAKAKLRGVSGYNDISGKAFLQKILPASAVGQSHIVGPVGVWIHRDACLDDLGGGNGSVSFLQVTDIAGVVEMGMGAENAF